MNKPNCNWYSTTHIVKHNPPLEMVWANGYTDKIYRTAEKSEDGTLYSKATYPTKIKVEDLPEWYMYGRYYKQWGWINIKNISDIRYKPNLFFNHLFRDDTFFITFNGKKLKDNVKDIWSMDYDMIIEGSWCTDLLTYLKIFGDKSIDIDTLIQQVRDKVVFYKENFPEELDVITLEEFDKELDERINNLRKRIDSNV